MTTHADAEGKVDIESDKDIVVPSGTPIAYKVWELEVNTTNGRIEPQIERGCQGGFVSKPAEADSPMDVADGNYPRS